MTTTVVGPDQVRSTELDMQGDDVLQVQARGLFSVASSVTAVHFTNALRGSIQIDGTLRDTATGGRAIVLEGSQTGAVGMTITNNGLVSATESGLLVGPPPGSTSSASAGPPGGLTIHNTGQWLSVTGAAMDNVGGAHVQNSGTVASDLAAAIVSHEGEVQVVNTGSIDGGRAAGFAATADGVSVGAVLTDEGGGFVTNDGDIAGDRDGIRSGERSPVVVTNHQDGVITGRNEAGVWTDNSASIFNAGAIRGGQQVLAASADGDGVHDLYGAYVENSGLIEGVASAGLDIYGVANVSDGLAIGSGTVLNHLGGVIQGADHGITVSPVTLVEGAPGSAIQNDGAIRGLSGYARSPTRQGTSSTTAEKSAARAGRPSSSARVTTC